MKDNGKPSILIVNRAYPPLRGATGALMHDLARHFVKAGHKVSILATTTGRPSHSSRGPISITRINGCDAPGFKGLLKGLWRLYRAMLRQPRHDVIITLSDPPLLYVAGDWAARRKKCAHVHWCHDVYPDLFPVLDIPMPASFSRLAFNYGRRVLARSACVVAISRCMQRHLTRTGIDIRKTAVIENWPDSALTAPAREEAVQADTVLPHIKRLRERRLYSDPSGQKFRVLYAGTLGRAHPLDAVLQAARILHKLQPDIEFVFVGSGPGFEQLAQARAASGLDNIRLMPMQPRAGLKALMESGDVHLITMRDDTLGMLMPSKFYAALAASRPAVFVGPAESDIARLIARYGCGRVVKPGDGKALATAIALYRTDADAWFAAHEGAGAALKGRLPQEAFALWSNVVKKVLHDQRANRT